jgi:long-chain acyl-CoA synthetase
MIDSLDLLSGRRPADDVIVEPSAGRVHSATAVRHLGSVFAGQLPGAGKCLVQLVADHSVDMVAVYLECLRLGHAVILVDQRLSGERLCAVRDAFQPDVVVDSAAEPAATARLSTAEYSLAASVGKATVLVRRDRSPAPLPPALAVMLATSGSLGNFRFVCLTFENLASNARAVGQVLGLRPDDRGALCLPLAYSYGLSVLNSHLATGGAVVLLDGAPSSLAFWRQFDATGCTTFAGVPETYRILAGIGHRIAAHPALRLATQAGGRMPEPLALSTAMTLADAGKELALMYGQTEATARITCQRGAEVLRSPGSVGTVIPGSRIWTAGPDGTRCPDGEAGEIILAGPGIMLGYACGRSDLLTLPPESPASLHTSDLGFLRDGRLYIVGRRGRLAKPLGVRVQLDEVEAEFATLGPAAAVAGADEVVTVYVEGSAHTYRSAYRAVLAAYALPPSTVRVTPIAKIPRTLTGKVAYAKLRT